MKGAEVPGESVASCATRRYSTGFVDEALPGKVKQLAFASGGRA
jgi:hypothetical protein